TPRRRYGPAAAAYRFATRVMRPAETAAGVGAVVTAACETGKRAVPASNTASTAAPATSPRPIPAQRVIVLESLTHTMPAKGGAQPNLARTLTMIACWQDGRRTTASVAHARRASLPGVFFACDRGEFPSGERPARQNQAEFVEADHRRRHKQHCDGAPVRCDHRRQHGNSHVHRPPLASQLRARDDPQPDEREHDEWSLKREGNHRQEHG